MTNRSKIAAVAVLAVLLSACSGGGEKAHEEAKAEGEARQTAPNSMASMPAGNAEHGKVLAETGDKARGQAACASCHGPTGNAPVTEKVAPENIPPRLAGQYADYLEHSLQMYRNGERQHSIMSAQATSLSDQDIADVAAYFAAQKGDLGDLATAH